MAAALASPELVGREAALTWLGGNLDRAASGIATTALISGTAGVGVSRFLADSTARLASAPGGWLVLRGRAYPDAADAPLEAIRRALLPALAGLSAAHLRRVVGPAGEPVTRAFPELRVRLAAAGLGRDRPAVVAPDLRQPRLFEALLGMLRRLADRQPVLLAIEDLRAADAATCSFLTFAGRNAGPERLCVVVTYEPDGPGRHGWVRTALAELRAAQRPPAELELEPFGRAELVRLVAAVEGERPSASTLVLVAERSRGLPLYAEELLAARRELSGARLAGSFGELVAARLALRSPACRLLARALAPAGRPLTREQLAIAIREIAGRSSLGRPAGRRPAGPSAAALDEGIAEAVESGLFLTTDAGLELRHERIARAIEGQLLPTERPVHQAAIAVALAGRPAAASRHWSLANRPAEARGAALAAADEAATIDAPQDELAALDSALEHGVAAGLDAGGGSAAGTLSRAADAAFAAGAASRAIAFAEAAAAHLDRRAEQTALGLLHDALGRFRRAAGDQDGALTAHRRAVDLVPASAAQERAVVLAGYAQMLMLHGTFSTARTAALAAIDLAGGLGPSGGPIAAHATTTLAVALAWQEDPDRGLELLDRALAMARRDNDLDAEFRVWANRTTVLDLLGRREEAVEAAYDGIDVARHHGLDLVYGNFLRGNAAESLFLLGRWAEAREFAHAGLTWSPTGPVRANSIVNLATIEIASRGGDSAGRLLGKLLLDLGTVPDPQNAVPVHRLAAAHALWLDDLADARRAADRGWALVHGTEDWVLAAKMAATVAEVEAMAVADPDARTGLAAILAARERTNQVLAEAAALVEAAGVPAPHGSRREADAHIRTAQAFAARLEGRAAPEAWDAVAATWQALGNRYEVARARWREAEAVLGTGGGRATRKAARGPLGRAAEIALELDARPLLRAVVGLAERARIPLPANAQRGLEAPVADRKEGTIAGASDGAAPSGARHPSAIVMLEPVTKATQLTADTFGLSRRERDVLALVAEGRTNREIGHRLFISQKTVNIHVGNILAKLDVSGRVEAASVAIRLGLVEIADRHKQGRRRP